MPDRLRQPSTTAQASPRLARPDEALRRLAALMGAALAREIAGKIHPTDGQTSGSPGSEPNLAGDRD